MTVSEDRLKKLLRLCDGSKEMLRQVLDTSYRNYPRQSKEWHLARIEAMLTPKTKTAPMSIQVPHSTIEQLRAVMPGQPVEWYIRIGQMVHDGLMPMPQRQIVETYRVQPQQPTTTAPSRTQVKTAPARSAKPKDEVSPETKAKLLELCNGNLASAERLVDAERSSRRAYTEENAWQRAYDKLLEEKMNLYTKIGYYS